MNIEKLDKIVDELKKYTDDKFGNMQDEFILSKAIEIYLHEKSEKMIPSENQDSNLATEKQISVLKRNKIKLDYSTLTKREASKLIDEIFSRQKAMNEEEE